MLGTDEFEILDYLKGFPNTFVSAAEICRRVGGRKRFALDRDWARPVLRRMEGEGLLESNEYAQYKLKPAALALANKTSANRGHREERCCRAITTYVLNMNAADDNTPFNALLREAITTEYSEQTS